MMQGAHQTNTTAGFIALGMQSEKGFERAGENIGMYELVYEATQYAPLVCLICRHASAAQCDFPGVIDYEVSEEFGKWFVRETDFNTGTTPERDACVQQILEMALEFFFHNRAMSNGEIITLGATLERARAAFEGLRARAAFEGLSA